MRTASENQRLGVEKRSLSEERDAEAEGSNNRSAAPATRAKALIVRGSAPRRTRVWFGKDACWPGL